MNLADLVAPERVVIPLEAPALPGAAWALAENLIAAGVVDDADKLRRRVEEERGEDIVALGDRAFLTHYRTDAVRDLVVAIGTSPNPIHRDLGEAEQQQARIVLTIVAPPRLAARYLQVLGAFARLLANPTVVEALLAAPTPQALAAVPALRDYELPPQLTVRDLMAERPRTCAPDTPLREAARDMVRAGLTALPVVDRGGLLVGMLSQRELMRHLLSNYLQSAAPRREPARAAARRTVRDVMTRQVLCVSPEQPLAEVASVMTNRDLDAVPVVREGRLVGFLTRGDIVRNLIGI